VGVKRVHSALADELDTIWARLLNETTFAKRRKTRQKHPMSENMPLAAGICTYS
jgi:uncharacterized Zn finger protein